MESHRMRMLAAHLHRLHLVGSTRRAGKGWHETVAGKHEVLLLTLQQEGGWYGKEATAGGALFFRGFFFFLVSGALLPPPKHDF